MICPMICQIDDLSDVHNSYLFDRCLSELLQGHPGVRIDARVLQERRDLSPVSSYSWASIRDVG